MLCYKPTQQYSKNNHLQWTNEEPETQNAGRPVTVFVTIMNEVSTNNLSAKKEKLAQVLARMAARSSLSTITDPVAWQQDETCQDANKPRVFMQLDSNIIIYSIQPNNMEAK